MRIVGQFGNTDLAAGWAQVRLKAFLSALCIVLLILLSYATVPLHRGASGAADVLLVLGSPTDASGYPGQEQRWRVDEAVREYQNGRAQFLLMSGGAVANEFTEASSMAEYALSRGVPAGAILEEANSRNTLENVRDSERIVRAHRWRRVEVISSEAHLHRAALLLSGTSLDWRTHAAPSPGWPWQNRVQQEVEEILGTALLRWCGLRAVPMLHRAKVAEVRLQIDLGTMGCVLETWREWAAGG